MKSFFREKRFSLEPRINNSDRIFKTIDSHTMGEPTRIVYDGFPEIIGNTMIEKKNYVQKHYEGYRRALMLEPRGHRNMFGALLTKPVHEEADYGVIFMDSGGYLNMCGHGSIGTASMLVDTGMIKETEPDTEVVLDAPAGIIRATVHIREHKALSVSILNVPSFVYKKNLTIPINGFGEIEYDISFGGSFFALVDADRLGLKLNQENLPVIEELGMKLVREINDSVDVHHPYLDISTVDLVEFYSRDCSKKADMKNCVIFGSAQADRSPCGTGTSAKLATLYAEHELEIGKSFVYESITGSFFTGKVMHETMVGGYPAIIPQITGSAYITGMNKWIIDKDDPLKYGFLVD